MFFSLNDRMMEQPMKKVMLKSEILDCRCNGNGLILPSLL